jgi:hypothetical protein
MKQKQILQIEDSPNPEPFENTNESYKECPYCGQSKIPFKLGVCICGAQVGSILYVKNTIQFAKGQYYSYVGEKKVEKLGIEELVDN